AERRQLASHLSLRDVAQKRTAAVVSQPHCRPALGEADDAAVALADDAITVRGVDILKVDAALEGRRYGPDLQGNDRRKLARGFLLELLAAGDAAPQHVRIVQGRPDLLPGRGELIFACEIHCLLLSSNAASAGDLKLGGSTAPQSK